MTLEMFFALSAFVGLLQPLFIHSVAFIHSRSFVFPSIHQSAFLPSFSHSLYVHSFARSFIHPPYIFSFLYSSLHILATFTQFVARHQLQIQFVRSILCFVPAFTRPLAPSPSYPLISRAYTSVRLPALRRHSLLHSLTLPPSHLLVHSCLRSVIFTRPLALSLTDCHPPGLHAPLIAAFTRSLALSPSHL